MAAFHPRTRLDSYVEGALSPSSHARVSAHLADCADCRREVGQRVRILRAASSLGPVPGSPSERTAADGADRRFVTVLEGRDGVAGWKVVLGFGAAGLLTSVVLMTAWIAGDPGAAAPSPGQSPLLSFARDSSPAAAPDGGRSPSPSGSGPSSGTSPGSPAPAGSILSSAAGLTADSPVKLTPAMVTDLRQAGWNVPRFHGLGMPQESTGWHRGDGVAEVVMTLSDGGHTLEFHECRTLRDGEPAPSCPVGGDRLGGTVETPAAVGFARLGPDRVTGTSAPDGADVVQLPVGAEMHLREHADGSWTAALATAQAGYAVASDLPVEDAPRVMSMVVISERSRVQGGSAPETPGDRLARGFERLLPWTGVTEPERR